MVVSEPEMISHEEVESSLQPDQQQQRKSHLFSSLGRQSSIYSLTLDEFQHTLSESGKNFGSMNMDEFLTSIWTAEGNQAINNASQSATIPDAATAVINGGSAQSQRGSFSAEKAGIARQPSLPRQGSLSIPAPLSRKTVDEVWSEIHKGQHGGHQSNGDNSDTAQNPESGASSQRTFGEMTLEDFLIKAGVVREPCSVGLPQPHQQQQQRYGMYQSNSPAMAPSFVVRPTMGMSSGGGADGGGGGVGVSAYRPAPQEGYVVGESSEYAGNSNRSGGYTPPSLPPGVCYGGRVVNNGGAGYGQLQPMPMAAPVSPVSPDGMCSSQVDNSTCQYGLEIGGLRGRKRIIDGPVERVVERRQRRMIKNRESAARSRARKQAYTVELEAELNQLREENAQLKQALAETEKKRKQQYFEEMKKVPTKAQRAKYRLSALRKNLSCSF